MSARKDLIVHLKALEKKLHRLECDTLEHKRYFIHLIKDNQGLVFIAMFSAFILGWRHKTPFKLFSLVKELILFSFFSLLAVLKQNFLLEIKKKVYLSMNRPRKK